MVRLQEMLITVRNARFGIAWALFMALLAISSTYLAVSAFIERECYMAELNSTVAVPGCLKLEPTKEANLAPWEEIK